MRATWLLPLSIVLGCPSATPTSTQPPTDTDTDTDTDTNTGPTTSVTGTVTDASGAPLADIDIRFCRGDLCLTARSDAAGVWMSQNGAVVGFPDVAAAPTSLELLKYDSPYATAYASVELEEDVPRAFDIVMLEHDAPVALGATAEWLTVGEGLRIQASTTDIVPPPFVDQATEVSGVLVPAESHPPLDGLSNVLAVWYVDPFDHDAPNGLPVEIDNTFGLADGDTVTVRIGDYTSSTWLDGGTLTANGALLTGDARLPLLSTVVITGPN